MKKIKHLKTEIKRLLQQTESALAGETKDYKQAFDLLTQVGDQLKEADTTKLAELAIQWAIYAQLMQQVLLALEPQKMQKEALDRLYRGVVENIARFARGCYEESYHSVYEVVVSAYEHLARNLSDHAQSEQEIEEAIKLINACFKCFEHLEVFSHLCAPFIQKIKTPACYETRILVYKKAKELGCRNELDYYKVLSAMLKTGLKARNPAVQQALSELRETDPFQTLRFGTLGESIQEAAERYTRAFELEKSPFYFSAPGALEQIQKEEQKMGFAYPESVKKFRLTVANEFHAAESINEFEPLEMNFLARGVASEIAAWYHMTEQYETEERIKEWREEFFGDLETYDYLDKHFKVIGTYKHSAEGHDYFLIGSNQKLGMVHFEQDYWQYIFDLIEEDGLNIIVKFDDFEAMIAKFLTIMINEHGFEDEEWIGHPAKLLDKKLPGA